MGLAALSAVAAPPGSEAPFEHPDPVRAFSEMKIYDAEGRPFRLPMEDWNRARKRVEGDTSWKAWLREQKIEVEDWIARRRDRVEWVCGWWHDFVSPKDGSFLTWTPETPGDETLSSPSDPEVKLTPKIMGGWVYGFRTRHGAKIHEAARLYRLTGEERYARWAGEQLDFYAENFEQWPVQTRGSGTGAARSRLFYQSLDEAVTLIHHVNAARLLADFAGAGQKQRWRDRLFLPQAAMLNESFQFIHNIACWQRAAMGCVAMLYRDEDLWRKAVDALFGIRQQIARGITGDYFWFEQSMTYNSYVARALLPFFEFAALTGRWKDLESEMAMLENLMLSPVSIRFPTGQVPNPADSTGGLPRAPNRRSLAAAYRVFPTPIGLSEAAATRSWETLLDPPPATPSGPPLPEVRSHHLESSRMAVLRRGSWQVFLHYGQLNASHAQAEALNYEAFHGTTDVSHDAGTVGYGSPLHREFYTRGPAHNGPLVNGQGQEGWNRGEMIRFDADRAVMVAEQPGYRRNAAARREMRIEGDRLVDIVTLTVRTNEPALLGLAIHLQGQVEVPAASTLDREFTEGPHLGVPAFRHWRDAYSLQATDEARFVVRFGSQRMKLTVAVRGSFRVVHASTPDLPPQRRSSLYLEVTGTQAEFRTMLEPAM